MRSEAVQSLNEFYWERGGAIHLESLVNDLEDSARKLRVAAEHMKAMKPAINSLLSEESLSSEVNHENVGASSTSKDWSRSPRRPSPEIDLCIQGFTIPECDDIQGSHGEEDWDRLRQHVSAGLTPVKQEDNIREHSLEVVDIDHVHFLQLTCSRRFKDGRDSTQLVEALRSRATDPLQDPNLILNVAAADIRCPCFPSQRHPPRTRIFWTLDHRRLHAMHVAGCVPRVRVRVKLEGHAFNEFANKSIEVLGRRSSIRLR